ncbi:MAG TPA: ABC transporter substrate-binding protein [Candidatus Binatus sp.]|nr:ABC transporter substrate-binding protein [Candidatus Binatus sp.]
MNRHNSNRWSRRDFLATAALAGTGPLLGLRGESLAAEPALDTTKLKLVRTTSICQAPQYVAEELLRGEGFTDIQYVTKSSPGEIGKTLASGEANINLHFAGPLILSLDAGDPIVILSGSHVGCFELFGTYRVRAIRDLKGKTVAVPGIGSPPYVFLSIMAAYVGLNPAKDINWITRPPAESMRLLAESKIDAYLGFPPEPQELRAKKIGHALVNSVVDRPWSQYFCCLIAGNREFVEKYPGATKRAMRAILKAADICSLKPEQSARFLVDKGFKTQYEYAFQTMKEVPYGKWRDFDPEDTVRFYALRLHEAGMIKNSPQKILAQGTDWRLLKELKKELKT